MAKSRKKSKSRVGLKENGRIGWSMDANRICMNMVKNGFAAKLIQEYTHLTLGQIMYRMKARGLNLTAYRSGKSPRALVLLTRYTVHSQSA